MNRSELKKFFAEIDEDDAWEIFCYAKAKFGWAGAMVTREDAELDWSELVKCMSYDDDDETSTPVDPVLSDEMWEDLRYSLAWRNIDDQLRGNCLNESNSAVCSFYEKKARGK